MTPMQSPYDIKKSSEEPTHDLTMALSRWFCSSNSKTLLVKIVHPGGRIELHDRPMMASEIMLQNPRCCVTYPDVFRQPSAVVPPDSVLLLGQKYYVVPISTLRKLQYTSKRQSPSTSPSMTPVPRPSVRSGQSRFKHQLRDGEDLDPSCWSFASINSPKQSYSIFSKFEDDIEDQHKDVKKEMDVQGQEGCFTLCLFAGFKADGETSNGDQSSTCDFPSSSETSSKTNKKSDRIKRLNSNNHWHPGLRSINENQSL